MSSRLQPQSGEAPSGERLRGKGRHGVKQKLMMTMTMMMAVALQQHVARMLTYLSAEADIGLPSCSCQ